jgi:S-adenosylmethionine:tRNA ribosyltransferase-isomerase
MTSLKAEDLFSYNLPVERIAQRPVKPYDAAKLLLVDRKSAEISEHRFSDLPKILTKSDFLVFNNTKVFPARLFGATKDTGARIEILLVAKEGSGIWRCLAQPMKKAKPGIVINLEAGVSAEVIERISEREVLLRFFNSSSLEVQDEVIYQAAVMPIPPYIREGHADTEDIIDYQSQFAKITGSIAAPTASLHFTEELINSLDKVGVERDYITLHLGTASFRALYGNDANEVTPPAAEEIIFDKNLYSRIDQAKSSGKRVIAVGTSMVRALESVAHWQEQNEESYDSTDLFIKPGHKFLAVDAIITNFHQPRSTHLCLVEAFLGRELLAKAYRYALDNDFRFLSYGDGMLVV